MGKDRYRSKFEKKVAQKLGEFGSKGHKYEPIKIDYIRPASPAKYTPDFVLSNGIIVEAKGRFTAQDRKKHLLVREQNPDLDIRFVFQNPNVRISKKSKTSYADWCDKHGFTYARGVVPHEWITE